MLLTTGIIALSRKIGDERTKRQEAKKGNLNVGDSDAAKQAFASQNAHPTETNDNNHGPGVQRAATQIRYEDPNDVGGPIGTSADGPRGQHNPQIEIQDSRSMSQLTMSTTMSSDKASSIVAASKSQTGAGTDNASTSTLSPNHPRFLSGQGSNRDSTDSQQPPPYSEHSSDNTYENQLRSPSGPLSDSSSQLSPTMSRLGSSLDTDTLSITTTSDNRSTMSRGTNPSLGSTAIRVKTKTQDLKSGFPYHPALFDARVHPDKWAAFTAQVIDSVKIDFTDNALMWGAAAGIAVTGFIGTSVYVGRSMKFSFQEKRVKSGINNPSAGGLGDTLDKWNEEYFSREGLYVHLELSESAMRNGERSKAFRRPAQTYKQREERDRKREERKFVLVVTKLNDDGVPAEAMKEISELSDSAAKREKESEDKVQDAPPPVEIASSDVPASIAELPAPTEELELAPVELPAELPASVSLGYGPDKFGLPQGYAELESDITRLLGGTGLEDGAEDHVRPESSHQ